MKFGKHDEKEVRPGPQLGIAIWEKLTPTLVKAVFVEFFCTLLFLYITIGSITFGCHVSGVGSGEKVDPSNPNAATTDCFLNATRVLPLAMVFGVAIFVLVYVAAAFSGGHLNPAVSLAFVITKKISLLRFFLYVIAQLAGATIGAALVRAMDKVATVSSQGGTNRLILGIPVSTAWAMECILTCALVLVVFAATDGKRAQNTAHLPVLAPMAIGFTVLICHLVALPIDGCSVNPARSFGAAAAVNIWDYQWIFWVGPLSGAVIAALIYELALRPHLATPEGGVADTHQQQLPGYSGVAGLKGHTANTHKVDRVHDTLQHVHDSAHHSIPINGTDNLAYGRDHQGYDNGGNGRSVV